MIATKDTTWRGGMNAAQWRDHVLTRLKAAGAVVREVPSGAVRIAVRDAYLLVSDIRHLSAQELDRLGA